MGKLLAISLLTTMAAAALFQPVLMGKPRETAAGNLDKISAPRASIDLRGSCELCGAAGASDLCADQRGLRLTAGLGLTDGSSML